LALWCTAEDLTPSPTRGNRVQLVASLIWSARECYDRQPEKEI